MRNPHSHWNSHWLTCSKLHLHLSASVGPPAKCHFYLSLTAVVWDGFTGAAGKLEKTKSAFSETMEIVTIYTIDFELKQNKNCDSAVHRSPSCLLHRQSCSEEGIKEKTTTVYLSIHINSLYINLWMLRNHLSLTFQHFPWWWLFGGEATWTVRLHTNLPRQSCAPEDEPNTFYLFIFFEAGINHQYLNCFASVWVTVQPNKCRLRSTISALSSLTLADKEIRLSPVKMCALCKTN